MNRWNPASLQCNIVPVWTEKLADTILVDFIAILIKYILSNNTLRIRYWLILELSFTFPCFFIILYYCCHLSQKKLAKIRIHEICSWVKIRQLESYCDIVFWNVLWRHIIVSALYNCIFLDLCPWSVYQRLSVNYENWDDEQNDN